MRIWKRRSMVANAARREVARRRLELAESLGLADYPEMAMDQNILDGDRPSLRKRDRDALAV